MSNTDFTAEISAMSSVAAALDPLEEAARTRVLTWAKAKFGAASPDLSLSVPEPHGAIEKATKSIHDFGEIAEFYHTCSPASDAEKALVVSAWFQTAEGKEGIDTFRVNSALKHLGYGIGNVTRAFDHLTNLKPALMIQLRKAGTTKQARKTFRVTDAGLKRVGQMLNPNKTDDP